jgi:hypothetical protein
MTSRRERDFIRSMPSEFQLVLLCSRTGISDQVRGQIVDIIKNPLNWPLVLEQARYWRLLPLLYFNLHLICPDQLPQSIRQEMQIFSQNNLIKNLILTDELKKILDLFHENGIDPVPFKGPVLAEYLYKNMSFRDASSDLDFFVPKIHVKPAVQLLQKMGYTLYSDHPGLSEDSYLKYKSHFIFSGQPHKPMVELHWDIAPPYFSKPFKFEEKLEHCIQVTFSEMSVFILEPVDLLQCLCIHLAIHYEKSPFWICDINELVLTFTSSQIEAFADRIRTQRCFRTAMLGIGLAQMFFGTPLPDGLQNAIARDRTLVSMQNADAKKMLVFCPPKPSKIKYIFRYVLYLVSLKDKWMDKFVVISSRIIQMIKTRRMISTPE